MIVDAVTLERVAGYAALTAMVSLLLAGVALALFFRGAGDRYGPINDLLSALTLVLLVPSVLAIRSTLGDDAGPLFGAVSLAALVGIAIGSIGQVLLVVGAIDLRMSFVTGGVGIVPVIAWAVALTVASFRADVLPDLLGWVTAAALGLVGLAALAASASSRTMIAVASVALLVGLEAWLATLAWVFLGQ